MQKYSVFSLIKNAFSGHKDWEVAWKDPTPKSEYDVIIIGGGGHGLATAYYLAKEHNITKVAIIENLAEPTAFGAFMAIFRSNLNRYLYLFISSPVFRQVIDEVNTNTINQITQKNLRSTLVPIPPFVEQNRIATKVDELMALCDQLEEQISITEADSQRVLESVLHESLDVDTREALV